MLRKAVDLAAQARALPVSFFDMTDSAALSFLSRWENTGQASLVEQLVRDSLYTCVWEAEIPHGQTAIMDLFGRWRDRLALEDALAAEAGLAPHEVVAVALASSAYRELPPLLTANGETRAQEQPPDATPHIFHVFVVASAARDYQRRLRMAAERHLGAMGATPLRTAAHE